MSAGGPAHARHIPLANLVKICGLRRPEHAVAAVEAGADLLGFLFAPSKRRVTLAETSACVEAAKAAAGGRFVGAVGLFVEPSDDEVREAIEIAGLDVVQIHGAGASGRWGRPLIIGLRVDPTMADTAADEAIDSFPKGADAPLAWLVDAYHPTMHGGTGLQADWRLAARLAARTPLLLAGGLTPENVADAIATVRPLGVDVSSGVESDGEKDPRKIERFVRAARAAFAAVR